MARRRAPRPVRYDVGMRPLITCVLAAVLSVASVPLRGAQPAQPPQGFQNRPPDFARMAQEQADTDKAYRDAAAGYYQVDKITYRSKVGDLEIPAWVFQPLKLRGPKGHAALVWVH